MYHLKEDIGSSGEGLFCIKMLFILEKDNRNQMKLERMVLPKVQGWQSMVKPATDSNRGWISVNF